MAGYRNHTWGPRIAGRPRRRTRDERRRTRDESATGPAASLAAATSDAIWFLARTVRLVATLVFALIVLGVVLVDVNANARNSLVGAIHDAANFLAGPFNGMFTGNGIHATTSINWGIAAVVYLIAGALIASVLRRIASRIGLSTLH